MWNEPSKERLAKIPGLYATEHVALEDKPVHLHFFIGGCDWYVCEFDGEDTFWGFAILNNDYEMAEWGYIPFSELKALKIEGWLEADCETEDSWQACKASEVEKIRIAHGWPKENADLKCGPKGQELIRKIRAGHFEHFQDLFSEVTSPYSDFFGIDPYPLWKAERGGNP